MSDKLQLSKCFHCNKLGVVGPGTFCSHCGQKQPLPETDKELIVYDLSFVYFNWSISKSNDEKKAVVNQPNQNLRKQDQIETKEKKPKQDQTKSKEKKSAATSDEGGYNTGPVDQSDENSDSLGDSRYS